MADKGRRNQPWNIRMGANRRQNWAIETGPRQSIGDVVDDVAGVQSEERQANCASEVSGRIGNEG